MSSENRCSVVSFNMTESHSLPVLYTLLSTKLRKQKRFHRFVPEDPSVHNPNLYALENDGTKIIDKTKSWTTFRTDCLVYWGDVTYFEITLEKTNGGYFVIGMSPLKNIHYDRCSYDMRFYPLDTQNRAELEKLVPGTRLGILYNTPKNEALLFMNGVYCKRLCDLSAWKVKSEPCTVVIALALGNTVMQINNDAVTPPY